jgi:hypothetical protein
MRWSGCLLLLLASLLSGCSEPPDKEHQQAVGALEAARAAGAATYATAQFDDAQAALKRYDESVAQHDYRQALNNALEARDLAYDAAKQAANRKAELRSQADRMADELETLVTSATTRLSAAGRPAGPAAARLRTARDAGRTSLQEARTRIQKQAYPDAIAGLTPAIEHLRREMPAAEPVASKRRK